MEKSKQYSKKDLKDSKTKELFTKKKTYNNKIILNASKNIRSVSQPYEKSQYIFNKNKNTKEDELCSDNINTTNIDKTNIIKTNYSNIKNASDNLVLDKLDSFKNLSIVNMVGCKETSSIKAQNSPNSKPINNIEDAILLNEENNVLIDNFMNKMGIKNKVDFNNNLNRLKIYKKILDENNANPTNIDNTKVSYFTKTNPNLQVDNVSAINNDNNNQESQKNNIDFNYKLIELSNKLIKSHKENADLTIKLKDLEKKQINMENTISTLTKEINNNKSNNLITSNKDMYINNNDNSKIFKSSILGINPSQINSNNQNNINISFNLGSENQFRMVDENTLNLNNVVKKITDENDKLKKFQNQVFEFSKSSDELTTSVIDTMKNVNIIIEQFNLGLKNDITLKKLIEQYFANFPLIVEKLEKSLELKTKEYKYLLTSKEEQIKMLSSEILISKKEKKKLNDQESEIIYLKNYINSNVKNKCKFNQDFDSYNNNNLKNNNVISDDIKLNNSDNYAYNTVKVQKQKYDVFNTNINSNANNSDINKIYDNKKADNLKLNNSKKNSPIKSNNQNLNYLKHKTNK